MRPAAPDWRLFSTRLLDAAGVGSLGAGAIFFVAANWQDYGLLGRFAILQAGILATAGLAFWKPPPHALGQASLVLAILLTGALLALFGQSYQTGADLYELFFIWFLLALPFTIAGNSGAAWATGWTVLNVGLAVYIGLHDVRMMQWLWSGRLGLGQPTLALIACVIDFAGAMLFVAREIGPKWLPRVFLAYGFCFGTVGAIVAIFGKSSAQNPWVIAGFALACGVLVYDTLRRKSDVFPIALVCGSWIAITTSWIIDVLKFNDLGTFFVLALWLIGTSSAAGWLLMRLVREWRVKA
jgi:uncharacterized membrane protein